MNWGFINEDERISRVQLLEKQDNSACFVKNSASTAVKKTFKKKAGSGACLSVVVVNIFGGFYALKHREEHIQIWNQHDSCSSVDSHVFWSIILN
ncbi:hypothetical protein C8N25_12144 [Algoriphagus antarcticus]|uniref:Uncharacterized protein n=1 Tax=Algoriphagus antarcticus TaxID=238540 RepID=A0A3E0DII5_9BACT|nr:hypothetical protein C8N25_12144 [Algoriphagus antarcticus]